MSLWLDRTGIRPGLAEPVFTDLLEPVDRFLLVGLPEPVDPIRQFGRLLLAVALGAQSVDHLVLPIDRYKLASLDPNRSIV